MLDLVREGCACVSNTAKHIRITGCVQGVGFRPFAWQLALETNVSGSVLNDGADVLIEVFGRTEAVTAFVGRLTTDLPPLARIDRIDVRQVACESHVEGFRILDSREGDRGAGPGVGIVPDAATCRQCLEEIHDPSDRRFHYAFTNCSDCGPRMSITRTIPYDRASTSMSAFPMCETCSTEYESAGDRRFHAQPTACPECGPRLWYEDDAGGIVEGDPLGMAAAELKAGKILAVKGLGGFQIAVDARNDAAVAELRRRKLRPDKPLALMARDLDQIREFCRPNQSEIDLLGSAAAPITLLEKTGDGLAENIASGQARLGFMLPNTPMHHLLMSKLEAPIVLTSGNLSNNPQEIENEAARDRLTELVDGFLMHDRDVVSRIDDSVMRLDASGPVVLRRGRGLVPTPIRVAPEFSDAPKVLAMGGELKSAFCLLNGRNAVLSQHIGDLENAPTFADYKKMLRLYLDLYRFEPEVIAVDSHPQYLSTTYGEKLAREWSVDLIRVQHHHAHLAACLAEHPDGSVPGRPVHGIILDGLGWGDDDTIWGGEILKGGFSAFTRSGHFQPVSLPGGAAAIREPWRNLAAHLFASFGPDYRDRLTGTRISDAFDQGHAETLNQMMKSGFNSPQSSSAGRLFDAIAAALGICFHRQSYEGQAAMLLENMVGPYLKTQQAYPVSVRAQRTVSLSFDALWHALIADLKEDVPVEQIAARFHLGLIEGLADAIRLSGASPSETIVLSGGVFQNAILKDGISAKLKNDGYTVLNHHLVPANDGGLALGQAAVAAVKAMRT